MLIQGAPLVSETTISSFGTRNTGGMAIDDVSSCSSISDLKPAVAAACPKNPVNSDVVVGDKSV